MLFYTQFEFLNHHQSTLIQTLPLAKGAKQLLPPEGDLKLHLCPRKYKRVAQKRLEISWCWLNFSTLKMSPRNSHLKKKSLDKSENLAFISSFDEKEINNTRIRNQKNKT